MQRPPIKAVHTHTHTRLHTPEVLLNCECVKLSLTVAAGDTEDILYGNATVQGQFWYRFYAESD